jgi:hypothetical protein
MTTIHIYDEAHNNSHVLPRIKKNTIKTIPIKNDDDKYKISIDQ